MFLSDNNFQYLNAERIGPRSSNNTSAEIDSKRELGKFGEFALHYFDQYQSDEISNSYVRHPNASTNLLRDNVNAWLGDITPNTKLKTYYNPVTQEVRGTFSTGTVEEFLPTNVGFGLTYVLPVIIALLTTKENGTVIIENPESHLHPRGQSRMAELIARCAASGRQVFIETHSDHIINGIMVEAYKHFKAKRENTALEGISNEKVKVYYFERKEKEEGEEIPMAADAKPVVISETGRIKNPPKGFFDQFETDLDRLLQ